MGSLVSRTHSSSTSSSSRVHPHPKPLPASSSSPSSSPFPCSSSSSSPSYPPPFFSRANMNISATCVENPSSSSHRKNGMKYKFNTSPPLSPHGNKENVPSTSNANTEPVPTLINVNINKNANTHQKDMDKMKNVPLNTHIEGKIPPNPHELPSITSQVSNNSFTQPLSSAQSASSSSVASSSPSPSHSSWNESNENKTFTLTAVSPFPPPPSPPPVDVVDASVPLVPPVPLTISLPQSHEIPLITIPLSSPSSHSIMQIGPSMLPPSNHPYSIPYSQSSHTSPIHSSEATPVPPHDEYAIYRQHITQLFLIYSNGNDTMDYQQIEALINHQVTAIANKHTRRHTFAPSSTTSSMLDLIEEAKKKRAKQLELILKEVDPKGTGMVHVNEWVRLKVKMKQRGKAKRMQMINQQQISNMTQSPTHVMSTTKMRSFQQTGKANLSSL